MDMIDLRSDTVTLPTYQMRQAMFEAEVGDDVYGEDPTVNHLEAIAAKCTGKEAALLVASGTMGNLICGLTHCDRGDEMIVGDTAHIFLNEQAGIASLGGVQVRPVTTSTRGMPDVDQIQKAIRVDGLRPSRTALVCLENTHNRGNGAAFTVNEMASIADLAHSYGVPVHLDGARIFNASVALNVPVSELTAHVDSLSFCLSKGLSCPMGSLVCGSKQFIIKARETRALIGGGTRQAGVIAAAGIVALETMVGRLAQDHANAQRLAQGLAKIPGVFIDPATIQTNIVYINLLDGNASELSAALRKRGVLANGMAGRVRFVTHYGITPADIDLALDAVEDAILNTR